MSDAGLTLLWLLFVASCVSVFLSLYAGWWPRLRRVCLLASIVAVMSRVDHAAEHPLLLAA